MAGLCDHCGAAVETLHTCDVCGAQVCGDHVRDHGCAVCKGGKMQV